MYGIYGDSDAAIPECAVDTGIVPYRNRRAGRGLASPMKQPVQKNSRPCKRIAIRKKTGLKRSDSRFL